MFRKLLCFSSLFCGLTVHVASAATNPLVDPNAVIVSRNNAHLTLADVDGYMKQRVPEEKQAGLMYSAKRVEALLKQLLLGKQLAAAARAHGLDKDPEFGKLSGLRAEEWLAQKEIERHNSTIKVPDLSDLVYEKYLANKEAFKSPDVLDAQDIVILRESRLEAEAEALAKKIHDEAIAKPGEFERLIAQYSESKTKDTDRGLLSDVTAKNAGYAVSDAVNQLKNIGDISPVVNDTDSLRILKLVKRVPGIQKPFEEVKEQILETLTQQYIAKQQTDYLDKLKNEPIEGNPDLVASLRTRYLPPGGKLPDELIKEMEEEKKRRATEAADEKREPTAGGSPIEK